jgi:hypothetical protein
MLVETVKSCPTRPTRSPADCTMPALEQVLEDLSCRVCPSHDRPTACTAPAFGAWAGCAGFMGTTSSKSSTPTDLMVYVSVVAKRVSGTLHAMQLPGILPAARSRAAKSNVGSPSSIRANASSGPFVLAAEVRKGGKAAGKRQRTDCNCKSHNGQAGEDVLHQIRPPGAK